MNPKQQSSLSKPVSGSPDQDLNQRLKDAEETLQAIRKGAVDALVVETGDGEQVYTLSSADYPYRLIIDNMGQGAVIFDDQGIIFHANATFARMVNYPHQQILGHSIEAFILEDDWQFFQTLAFSHSTLSGRTGNVNLVCKDRPELSIFVDLTSLKIDEQYLNCAILTDLTEQKKYDLALAEGKLSRMILEQTGDAVVVCDSAGRIIRKSRATDSLARKNCLHHRFEDIFHVTRAKTSVHTTGSEAAWTDESNLVEEVVKGKTLHGLEATCQIDGEHIPLLINAQPLLDEDKKVLGAIITMIDITIQKRSERELQELNDSLERRIVERTQDLLKYQDHLRGMASELVVTEQRERRRLATELHDYLAQLLVICRMKLSQMMNQKSLQQELKPYIEDIDKHLTDSLSYTRTLIAELSPNILYELGIGPALVWLAGQMERHGLQVHIQDGEPNIQLPEDQAIFVFQAVREMLFNVIKHAGVSEATVALRRNAQEELEVLVEDAGNGFQPSWGISDYTKPGKFGLFSIQERMEALGGQFQVRSAPGKGTQASLIVPLNGAASPVVSQNTFQETRKDVFPSVEQGPQKPVVRILLVDDHAMIRQGIRTLLENQHDFLVVGEAQNGEEALEVTEMVRPEVVVMDVNMPKLNGIEATRILTKDHPSISVIGLSVHEDKHVEKLMIEAGASGYVKKGSVASQLVEAIHQVVKQHC